MTAGVDETSSPRGAATGKGNLTAAPAAFQGLRRRRRWPRTRESLGMGRVSIWPLWTILLLMWPLGGLGPPLCPREPFYFLVALMKMLGNKNDGTLYTPDDFSVCPAETLGCFRLELSVIGLEEGPSVGTAVFRLQRLLDALGSRLWGTGQGPCPPCEGHPQRPVPLFLAKLLELLQGACARRLPST
ncbi:PREDICTED: uncharacterized protein LOC106803717 [Ceratotherium simum simum]|uniref:Uncharacterized protein LOC106803717 n=1 Tax=Ceratotherium simum simum TaxID=73337 RepID=A0ABM1DIE1_CERSS|nr:PREDICTED: uncharacterized protein LOC106803717 [Ceratotherium simum simum]